MGTGPVFLIGQQSCCNSRLVAATPLAVFGVLGDVHIDRFIVGNGPMKTWNWEGPFEDVGPDDDIPTHWYGESGCSWWSGLLSDVDAMN